MVTVLLRGEQQALVVGKHIRVRVLSIIGPHVEVQIEAPENLPVHREEVVEEIRGLLPGLEPRAPAKALFAPRIRQIA
jgi:carbon storage regulator CsrA